MDSTPIIALHEKLNNNAFYMKRDDLLPFSFGGNKARKAEKFKEDILRTNANAIVTYGSSESNHCRIIANMAKSMGIDCYIISPSENYKETYNSRMINMFGADITIVPVNEVHDTIEDKLEELKTKGLNPYFIPGGGHGNLGTQAYVDCYKEIKEYENENNLKFDYIFFASGTGTTQAGLVCGQVLSNDFEKNIVGISIARNKERGQSVIMDSIEDYLRINKEEFEKYVCFIDDYTINGYDTHDDKVIKVIKDVLFYDGVALNTTYTGKAFYGMLDYIEKNHIENKNVLFINTGGLPLFFDDMEELSK